jgi:hypothetical protein
MSIEKKLSEISLFISSTFLDLEEHRGAVIKRIEKESGIIHAQEFFGSRPNNSLTTCIEEVEKSDVVILILAHRYGSVDGDSQKSYTEIEYEKAVELKKLILVYIIDDNHDWPPKHIDKENYKKIEKFREKVTKGYTFSRFSTPDDLANKVFNDLLRELPIKGFKIGGTKDTQIELSTKTLLEKFNILPKLYNYREFLLPCSFGKTRPMKKNECEAFYLPIGASISREIFCKDREIQKKLDSIGSVLYASGENAKTLAEYPSEREFKITAQTAYGYTFIEREVEELVYLSEIVGYSYLTISATGNKKIITKIQKVIEYKKGLIFMASVK